MEHVMKIKKIIVGLGLWIFLFNGFIGLAAPEESIAEANHDIYAELLKKYVKSGVVEYKGLKNEEAYLDKYLKILERTDPERLSRNSQFAFYINAYNAWTIKLILNGYPGLKSIKDLGGIFTSPWKKQIARINGEVITLDHIEHDILRPRFKDPRVHFAINCAAKSCPPLRPEPYRANALDRQLDEMARAFINDSQRNRLEGRTLYASRIFKWFAKDFNNDVPGFFLEYAQKDLKKQLEESKSTLKIKYLDYDWSLNGQ
jgi:hypothetical protein